MRVASKLTMAGSELKILTLVFAVTLFGSTRSSPSVIVVGAGAAGIAAATRLLENNFTNVTVLEAEDRIGGRIHSVKFGDALVDLGAEWCHGQKGNIVYETVEDLGILRNGTTEKLTYYSNREEIDEELVERIWNVTTKIYFDEDYSEEEGTTLGEMCERKYNLSISAFHLKNPKLINYANDALTLFEQLVLGSEGSFSWFDTSANSDFEDCEGYLNLDWNGLGYKTILDVMMKNFGNVSKPLLITGKILLKKEVSQVIWKDDDRNPSGVTVICADGSEYSADYAIFTPSLGVLKETHLTLFKPQLPKDKQLAISTLGFGAVIKFVTHFPAKWWPERNFAGFYFVWSREDRSYMAINKTDKLWVLGIYGVVPSANNPNVLTAWFVGEKVPEIEQFDDETVLQGIQFVLKKFLGHKYNISAPDYFIRSNWYTNPHFRGTYSYQTVASRQKPSNIDLARPLQTEEGKLTLLFSGEASHATHFSTVHGAIESGYREAQRIINLSNAA